MISAFFDDSGTHASSSIVVVAGVVGREGYLDCLARAWAKELQNPIEGRKKPVRRFHMVECRESRGDYAGWTRTETDWHTHLLRDMLIQADVGTYGIAVSRKDWDELVLGNNRKIFGDAEQFCAMNCMLRAQVWAQTYCYDTSMRFVFDDRTKEFERHARIVHDAYKRWVSDLELSPGIEFKNSHQEILMQAADMVAWEVYQHAKHMLETGTNDPPVRNEMRQLVKGTNFMGQVATRETIEHARDELWSNKDPELMDAIADHFSAEGVREDVGYITVAEEHSEEMATEVR
jgi:hypothetical protein